MKPSTVLEKARKLIERGWTKGGFAVDRHGREVDNPRSNKVVRMCNGCAMSVAGADDDQAYMDAWGYLQRANPGALGIVTYSYTKGASKAKSIGYFDRAIKLAISEGK